MALIKSISGIRGTIGGLQGDNLTPIDILKFTTAFAIIMKNNHPEQAIHVVVGRDARISGNMVNHLVCGTLLGMGINVIDIGLSTTPTVEMEVIAQKAHGGIIITASHNPMQWNALKLLNEKGEFFSAQMGKDVLEIAENIDKVDFATATELGKYTQVNDAIARHIEAIKQLDLVDVDAIKNAHFHIAVDCVNSTGGIAIPQLLKELGVEKVHELNCTPDGMFPHIPEPLPENLTTTMDYIKHNRVDAGFVVDPDVDRLAIIQEDGTYFGEEYTLVSVAEYVLSKQSGNTVSNLSSTQALKIVTEKHGGQYSASAVGEVNVVEEMKRVHAVIGGEGNGGVIYPALHYGRDALVGIALFLTALAKKKITCSAYRQTFPNFFIYKDKIQLTPDINVDNVLAYIKEKYKNEKVVDIDGVKILFNNEWVHLRKSNTEPIIRIYAESIDETTAKTRANQIRTDIAEYNNR
ncbi:MAG: phosphoglucosamine mutase [Bacteroidales bacterium]|nr:phosphoglucosamine mutase [Bacteroidales bacterium]